ncbi:phosphatase PAP2 family protein [Kitasatospora sp. NBC_00458]|uniref:phosphatase PAP2 family protein n=1 Tax=Kitasatospora sp. NBC_00458 TaxID=2903568 RepID=UPI002E193B7F
MSGHRVVRTALASAAFALLAGLLALRGWVPFGFEERAVSWAAGHRPPVAREAVVVLTSLGTGAAPYLLMLAAGFVCAGALAAPRVRWRSAVVLLAPVLWLLAGQLVRQGLMHGFGRPRPPVGLRAAAASGFAFPSGHTFTSAVCAGLVTLAVARTRPDLLRPTVTVAALFALAVGASRVYLGVHWPLDVLGGWLLAAAWLALGTVVLDRVVGFASRTASNSGQ